MAVQTDHTQSQYVDLGPLPEACITVPETCACGATFSAWMKYINCPWPTGAIGSYYKLNVASFVLLCGGGNTVRYAGYQSFRSNGSFTLHGIGNGNGTGNGTWKGVYCSHCCTGNGRGNRRNLWPGTWSSGEMGMEPICPLSPSHSHYWSRCSVYST